MFFLAYFSGKQPKFSKLIFLFSIKYLIGKYEANTLEEEEKNLRTLSKQETRLKDISRHELSKTIHIGIGFRSIASHGAKAALGRKPQIFLSSGPSWR